MRVENCFKQEGFEFAGGRDFAQQRRAERGEDNGFFLISEVDLA